MSDLASLLACPPPPRFVPAREVSVARIARIPGFAKRQRYTGRRLEGIKYEKRAQNYLSLFDENYIPGFWLNFLSDGKWKYCQPDGLRIDVFSGRITIVEIKFQHTSDAWWQTKQLYYPVMRALFPEPAWTYDFCEVVKWFDPATKFPEEIIMSSDPFKRTDKFKVHIWRP